MSSYKRNYNQAKLDKFIMMNSLSANALAMKLNMEGINPENVNNTCYDICRQWMNVEWDEKLLRYKVSQ